MKGTCEIVRERIQDSIGLENSWNDEAEKNCELLAWATDTVMTTTRMVADVSDLARFDEGASLKTQFESVNLRELGTEAIENVMFNSLRMSGSPDGISVSLELVGMGGSSFLCTDRTTLLRVFAHLLENSVREVNSNGKVTLKITSNPEDSITDANVRFEVIDDGKGLPLGTCLDQGDDTVVKGGTKQAPIHRYAIGRRSFVDPDDIMKARVDMEDKLRDLKQNGVGVGLPLSYHLVRALGGDLRHDSKHEGGTRVWFALFGSVQEEDGSMDIDEALLESETIAKTLAPPRSIDVVMDRNQDQPKRKRRVSELGFASFSPDVCSVNTGTTAETSVSGTVATRALEPAPRAVAQCGVKASMPFSVLIVEDTDICKRFVPSLQSKY